MSDKCAGGFTLPKDGGKCPKCGASSSETCGEWVRNIVAENAALTAERDALRNTLKDISYMVANVLKLAGNPTSPVSQDDCAHESVEDGKCS